MRQYISNENVQVGVTYTLIWARRTIMRRWMKTCGISALCIPSIQDLDDIWMIYGRWMAMEVGGGWERHFKDGRFGGGDFMRLGGVYEYRSTFTTSTLK